VTSHGLPDRIYADNGKEFDSAAMQGQTKQMRFGKIQVDPGVMAGVLGGLKIAMTHAIAFNAKAKPVERCFGTVCGRFSKLQSTYCGNKPENRPPSLKGKLERGCAPELADFITAFELWLEGDYHSRPHTGDSMDGRTPNAVFETYLESKRTAPVEILEVMLWKPSRPTKATKDGVRFGGIGYGNREPALIQRLGKEVIVRVDRNHAGRAAICETDGRFICFAPSTIRLPFNTKPEELKEHLAAIKRGNKQIREAYRSRPRPVHDVAASIYEARAEEDRKAREAANIAPPSLVAADTPMSGQLAVLQRGLGGGPQLAIQSDESAAAERGPSMREMMAKAMLRLDAEEEQRQQAKADAQAEYDKRWRKAFGEAEAG
jgi:hypothetical protein